MPNYTNIIDYTLYDFDNKHGRVQFLDDSAKRALLVTQIKATCSLVDS